MKSDPCQYLVYYGILNMIRSIIAFSAKIEDPLPKSVAHATQIDSYMEGRTCGTPAKSLLGFRT